MKYYFYLSFIVLLFSCNNERVLQLPEIENAKITEVLDVSPAYIFYDETQPDSTLLNRKNLITTTNWLVNVDKRLTLKQAIPHIKFLQDKKRNAKMHKNENAKNYFTCNDTSIGSLGFVEFTDVNYLIDKSLNADSHQEYCHVIIKSTSNIQLVTNKTSTYKTTAEDLKFNLEQLFKNTGNKTQFVLGLNNALTFQEYIGIKTLLRPFEENISKSEFIFYVNY